MLRKNNNDGERAYLPVSGSDWKPSLIPDMERFKSTLTLRRVDSGEVNGDAGGDSMLPTGWSIRFSASLSRFRTPPPPTPSTPVQKLTKKNKNKNKNTNGEEHPGGWLPESMSILLDESLSFSTLRLRWRRLRSDSS